MTTTMKVRCQSRIIVAEPVAAPGKGARRRYTLTELLVGAEHLPDLYRATDGALDGIPIGDEFGSEPPVAAIPFDP